MSTTKTQTSSARGPSTGEYDGMQDAPGRNDVLFGRGKGASNHEGNKHFRVLIEQNKRRYFVGSRQERVQIAAGIVLTIRGLKPAGGRFLRRDARTGEWCDVGDRRAHIKVAQALRERAHGLHQELERKHSEESRGDGSRSDDFRAVVPSVSFPPISPEGSSSDSGARTKDCAVVEQPTGGQFDDAAEADEWTKVAATTTTSFSPACLPEKAIMKEDDVGSFCPSDAADLVSLGHDELWNEVASDDKPSTETIGKKLPASPRPRMTSELKRDLTAFLRKYSSRKAGQSSGTPILGRHPVYGSRNVWKTDDAASSELGAFIEALLAESQASTNREEDDLLGKEITVGDGQMPPNTVVPSEGTWGIKDAAGIIGNTEPNGTLTGLYSSAMKQVNEQAWMILRVENGDLQYNNVSTTVEVRTADLKTTTMRDVVDRAYQQETGPNGQLRSFLPHHTPGLGYVAEIKFSKDFSATFSWDLMARTTLAELVTRFYASSGVTLRIKAADQEACKYDFLTKLR